MITRPVIRATRFVLAHVPNLVYAGSKPRREMAIRGGDLRGRIRERLRTFRDAVAYAPHQVMIGNRAPEDLWSLPRPWHAQPETEAPHEGPAGAVIDESAFYAWLARADAGRLMRFDEAFAVRAEPLLRGTRIATASPGALRSAVASGGEPIGDGGDRWIGVVLPGHAQDESLAAPVLLENLATKATGALALQRLLDDVAGDEPVDFLLGCGEEAVGDRYQRGGGNLAKAIGELAGIRTAGGADVKAFCAGPVHALIIAASLVASGVHRRVVVVAGGSLAKLGMKFLGHLASGYPILEDVLVGVAIDVVADDGLSPVIALEAAAVHRIGDGAAPHQMAAALTQAPLRARGLRLSDVDRFAVELHNPDITEPAGSGDVPRRNYQVIAALAAQAGEIDREGIPAFVRRHGLPGFSPTQGHIPSAIPYLPHAIAGLTSGKFRLVQLVAKGSLFLGRMTEMADGASLLLERNAP
ncbi:MAG TPA: glycine/sarcosine/betaine reductase complex component C subunit beta [bacterium]|nr:glycine/sarcosine/betaine reductase complex component C subunit beta [bacterium]